MGKRAAILGAAKEMFVELGFNGVSMDDIAARAGVSKLTVYSHFGDKEALFTEAIRAKCEETMPGALFLTDRKGPLREQLRGIGHAFFTLICSDSAIATQRMMMAPETDDRIRRMFWQAGPLRVETALAEFLGAHAVRGELAIGDPRLAARQFFCLIKGDPHARMICGLGSVPSQRDADAHIAATVDFFIRACAPRPQSEPADSPGDFRH